MREVVVKLRFLTPCLGHIRGQDIDKFAWDTTHTHIVFMQTWWHKLLEYGANALGRHQVLINEVRVSPRIAHDKVTPFRRYYGPHKFTVHEALQHGDTMTIRAILPAGLPEDDFRRILTIGGEYRGISPYGWQDGYGQFEVLDGDDKVGG